MLVSDLQAAVPEPEEAARDIARDAGAEVDFVEVHASPKGGFNVYYGLRGRDRRHRAALLAAALAEKRFSVRLSLHDPSGEPGDPVFIVHCGVSGRVLRQAEEEA